uniref:TetR/AcrR family transcriptional regulator n=1 Tax=Pseudomonas aeruginosa TaxID=287 RepID=A0A2R4PHC3_PSEAI|nr:TetR/AcrR family transcriptional regulator [Pseudomonas aeruginosa]
MLRRERSPHADGVLCKAVAYCRPVAPEPAVSQAQRHARPLNRSESQVRTRAALLDAAEALIVEHSIPALSLRAVCTRAGYTQGAFYSNFADREELLLEVMERNLEQKAASLEQMLATCGDAGLDGTLACILDWLDTIHHRGEWARIAMELGYRKFNRPFWRVWRVGSGRASAALGTDRAQIGGSCVGFRHRGATQRLSA